MTSRTGVASLAAATCMLLLVGCESSPARVCDNEADATLSDGTIRRHTYRAVNDPTVGGRLQRRPEGQKADPKKMLLLLDFSGSMFGGYGSPRPEGCSVCAADLNEATQKISRNRQPYYFGEADFQDMLASWLDAATPAGSGLKLEILLFNAQLWHAGPEGVSRYDGPSQLTFDRDATNADASQIMGWLSQIPTSPYDVDGSAPNRTESKAAILSAIEAIEDEAIVWLFTDNIVDSSATDEDARRNLEFYEALKQEPRIQMISAYPLSQEAECDWMCGAAIFAYGMYVSHLERPDSSGYHRLGGTVAGDARPSPKGLLWNPDLKTLAARFSGRAAAVRKVELAGVPLRLKPIDADVLTLDFELYGGQALKCDRTASFGDKPICLAEVRVRNTLRHQVVDSAKLEFTNGVMLPRRAGERSRLAWASAVCDGNVQTLGWKVPDGASGEGDEPIELGPLAPLEEKTVQVYFELPTIDVDTSDRADLLDIASTNQILLDGHVSAELTDVRTSLYIDTEGLEDVYGAPELPAIFRGRQQARIKAEYPAGAVVANDGQLLGMIILLGGGGLVLLIGLIVTRFQRVQFLAVLDGAELAKLSMPRVSSRILKVDGKLAVRVRRGWGPSLKVTPTSGNRLKRDGPSAWVLIMGGALEGDEFKLELRRGWSRVTRTARSPAMDDWD